MSGERDNSSSDNKLDDLFDDVLDFLNKREVGDQKFAKQGELIVSETNFDLEVKQPYLAKMFKEKFKHRSTSDPREAAPLFKGTVGTWLITEANNYKLSRQGEKVNIVTNITMSDCMRYAKMMCDENIRAMGQTELIQEKRSLDEQVKRWSYWATVAEEAIGLR